MLGRADDSSKKPEVGKVIQLFLVVLTGCLTTMVGSALALLFVRWSRRRLPPGR